MVQINNLFIATLSALLPTLASARACNKGYTYCGHTLLDIGVHTIPTCSAHETLLTRALQENTAPKLKLNSASTADQ